MSIEALKEQARRHEQKEEWQKALVQYKKAIEKLAEEDQPDIGLYNRVGDLYVRVGSLDDAVGHYEQAIDLYLETFLPNNAIAVCKKIIRNVPARNEPYLRMGQIRAEQGFLSDARTNFLTYAERMQQAGDLDESFRALVEFCDLAPDEVDVRLVVADQMASHERIDDAVDQLSVTYRHVMAKGDSDRAAEIEAKIRELNPDADLAAVPAMASVPEPGVVDSLGEDDAIDGDFGEIEFGDGESEEAEAVAEPEADVDVGTFEISVGGDEDEAEDEAADDEAAVDEAAVDDDTGAELPMMDFTADDGDDGDEDDAGELPTFELPEEEEEEEDQEEAAAAELPTFDVDEESSEAEPLPIYADEVIAEEVADEVGEAREEAFEEAAAEAPAVAPTMTLDEVRAQIDSDPDDVDLRQRMVELAYGGGDEATISEAFQGLGEALTRAGETSGAKAAFQQALQADPTNEAARAGLGDAPTSQPVREVAAHEDYVDLGAMILGDDEEKSTRFVVAYEEPTGDEEADFAKMLSQFKDKVSENLDADDVRAHHDLGTAYKEMGLLDEAIGEFQAALRASAAHLPTYEMMGMTFMEMGQADAAVRSLERALDVEHDIEDELIGIYYYLAKAYEELGNTESALEFYDRVFSLDINFADVTERLRALR